MKKGYGEILKNAREKKGLKISDVNKKLKINELYVQSLENEECEIFEKKVYQKMFLKTYAVFLGVDYIEIFKLYEKGNETDETKKKGAEDFMKKIIRKESGLNEYEKNETEKFNFKNKKNIIIAGFAVIAVFLTVILIFVLSGNKKDENLGAAENIYVVKPQTDLKVIAKAKADVWMKTRIAGKEEDFLLKKGDVKKWKDIQKIVFLIGNAGGVEFIVNGDSIGVIGEEGEVINGLVFEVGKNWYINKGQAFKQPRKVIPMPDDISAENKNTINEGSDQTQIKEGGGVQ